MNTNFKIAGCVILFNPIEEYVHNIFSYIDQVEKLYIIDNSENPLPKVFVDLHFNPKILFIKNKENLGISSALNQAVNEAVKDHFDLLLTMDQDSFAEPEMVKKLLSCYQNDKIAIVSPAHDIGKKLSTSRGCHEAVSIMTSGNLINLQIILQVGGFNDKLFIDYVDHEICVRLRSKGFIIIVQDNAVLRHGLGNIAEKKILFAKYYPTHHSPLRYYYQTRNRFYIYKKYWRSSPGFVSEDIFNFIKLVLKMILSEKYKLEKIKYMIRGFSDFRKNKFGRYLG